MWAATPPSWIEHVKVSIWIQACQPELGIGEREAISLALEVQADILLIDDRAGRQAAEARMLPIAGTLAVLLQVALSQRLDLPVALARLRGSGFRASPAVVAAIPARYNAARRESWSKAIELKSLSTLTRRRLIG